MQENSADNEIRYYYMIISILGARILAVGRRCEEGDFECFHGPDGGGHFFAPAIAYYLHIFPTGAQQRQAADISPKASTRA